VCDDRARIIGLLIRLSVLRSMYVRVVSGVDRDELYVADVYQLITRWQTTSDSALFVQPIDVKNQLLNGR